MHLVDKNHEVKGHKSSRPKVLKSPSTYCALEVPDLELKIEYCQ